LAILADLGPRYGAHHADVLVVATEYAKELARPMLREECRRLAEPADVDSRACGDGVSSSASPPAATSAGTATPASQRPTWTRPPSSRT